MSQMRDICLPLEKLDRCRTCDKTSDLRLCSKCGESIYCSEKCQSKDWPRHKRICSKIDRIDLATLYPFLASLAEIGHCRQWKPFHPALTRYVTIPEHWPPTLGGAPIVLGVTIPGDEFTLAKWVPGQLPDNAWRRKLFQRILHDNYTLPMLMSISIALLASIYTTKEVRLIYRGSPISDFGIAKGSVNVKDKNRLVYIRKSPIRNIAITMRGQDPNEHYWLYFKNLKEEEGIVDLAAGVFNLGSQVRMDPYVPGLFPGGSFAPVLFQESPVADNDPGAHREKIRFSVLRNSDLHAVARHATRYRVTGAEADLNIWDFMDTVAGRGCKGVERMITIDVLQASLVQFESLVEERAWKKWPRRPECRPYEDDADSDERWRDLMRWKNKNKSYIPQDPFCALDNLFIANFARFGDFP